MYIHPFPDCNGRTSRILMNSLLLQYHYPPVMVMEMLASSPEKVVKVMLTMHNQANLGNYTLLYRTLLKSIIIAGRILSSTDRLIIDPTKSPRHPLVFSDL